MVLPVLQVADEFFDEILHGDQAQCAAVAVNDDGDGLAGFLHEGDGAAYGLFADEGHGGVDVALEVEVGGLIDRKFDFCEY